MDKKTFAIGFVIFFLVATVYLYYNNDAVAQIIANDGTQGIIYYVLSNPAYILLLFSIFYYHPEVNALKKTLASLMIVYASDIISYPRLPPAALPTNIDILASLDGLAVHKLLAFGLSYNVAWTIYYLILPIALVIGALAMLGHYNFFNMIARRSS